MTTAKKRTGKSRKSASATSKRDAKLERYKKALGIAIDTIEFYADPEQYHAIMFVADRPAGAFADDFDEYHGNSFYDRPMPGKTARLAIKTLREKYGKLTFILPEDR